MKKLLLANALFILVSSAYSQTVVVAKKMNVLYIGVENPISIALGNNILEKETEVKISEGTIKKIDKMHYTVLVNKTGNVEITIFYKGIKFESHLFRVKRIPNPIVSLRKEGMSQSYLMGTTIKSVNKLNLELNNFEYNVNCNLISFQFSMVSSGKDLITFKNIGAVFNTDVNHAIQRSQSNDTLYFDDIKARCPGDIADRTLNSMVFLPK
jgi:GldM C-terminal domain